MSSPESVPTRLWSLATYSTCRALSHETTQGSQEPGNNRVTIRELDSMSQIRVPVLELGLVFFQELLAAELWPEVPSPYALT